MSVSIPSVAGVPGIGGPPNWFPAEAGHNFRLDDVRWRGAIKRTFGNGTAGSNYFRATQEGGVVYLTFRAAFVQQLDNTDDLVYLGLQNHTNPNAGAMVIKIKLHNNFNSAGPPSGADPGSVAEVDIWTLSGGNWNGGGMSPSWINANARMWVQSSADLPMTDANNRWAVQLRIPAGAGGGITDNSGPNLGNDFDMWYLMHSNTGGNPVIAEYRKAGPAFVTNQNDLDNLAFPQPNLWDDFKLTFGPGNSGGVALYDSDVVVQNVNGEGTLIHNHGANDFVARPRNYSGVNIPAGQINATFRIANWGSVPGFPGMPDFTTGQWDYVAGNSEILPVDSNLAIGPIPAGTNPPNTTPIKLHVDPLNLTVPPKSLHQCVLTTLSGANINFLNDAIYTNMDYDGASLLQREAEISVVGLKPFAPTPRDVYLAVEKINMPTNTSAGTDEGQFLAASMSRLMRGEGELAGKLKRARSILSDVGQGQEGQSGRLQSLVRVLSDVGLSAEETDQLFPTIRIHAYYDTGERVVRNGEQRPVLRAQSSFGLYVYHEGSLEGWQTSIQGAQRIEDNLYLLAVPNNGTAKITTTVQAVGQGDQRIPDDPIKPLPPRSKPGCGCLGRLLALLGLK